MKLRLKILGIALVAILIVVSTTTAIIIANQEEQDCCLCNSFRYHAPCLIDLETGNLIELDLYCSHHTLVAELAEPQPEMNIFSFVRLGNASGIKETSQRQIRLDVPSADKTANPVLCAECRKQLQFGYWSRYVLADLYSKEEKTLIPIKDNTEFALRCYEITMKKTEDGSGIRIIIQGVLDE